MLLYYAMGGGLGHLTRARAFLHTTGLDGEAALFTSSRFAEDPRVTGGLPVVKVPADLDGDRGGLRALLGRTIAELGARRLVVDALPAGILGELADFSPPAGLEIWHVARLLRWERYAADASARLPRFDVTYELEQLHEDHRRALEASSGEIRRLELVDPRSPAPEPIEASYVLVVHGGPDEETADLVACARELARVEGSCTRIVLAAPARHATLLDDVAWVDVFPATGLFGRAERIVTAAGFNAVRHTEPFRSRRFLVPYPRRFDDQFTRAARARIPGR
jgi:predicted glycosyltransferase